jgi:PTS system nitrogen regulatory IIA component
LAEGEGDDVRSVLVTAEEVSKILAIPPRRVYEMAKRGDLPSVKIGRLVRFRRQAVEDWVALQERGSYRPRPGLGE